MLLSLTQVKSEIPERETHTGHPLILFPVVVLFLVLVLGSSSPALG